MAKKKNSKDHERELVLRVVAILRQERLKQELSMYRLAKISTISDRTIAKIESGAQSPTLYTICKLASALDIDVSGVIKEAEKF